MTFLKRAALIFGAINLLIGISSLAAPLVKGSSDKVINRQPGLYLGVFATDWIHSVIHILVGAVGMLLGLVKGIQTSFSRTYFIVNSLLFGSMAGMGWARFGTTSGVHKMMGVSVNRYDHILHTVWGLATAILATQPKSVQERISGPTHPSRFEGMNI